jgi:hypothetical protein
MFAIKLHANQNFDSWLLIFDAWQYPRDFSVPSGLSGESFSEQDSYSSPSISILPLLSFRISSTPST